MELLEVGKIVNTHGLRGEVKAVPWTDYPEVFEDIEYVYVKRGEDDIDEAQKYKNLIMYAPREMLGPLPEGVHYIADLIGLEVVTDDGRSVGTIEDVFNTGSNDIYDIKREGKKNMLLPVIDEVVLDVDTDAKKVTVHMIDGLEDL